MAEKRFITVVEGDGVGPEIIRATLGLLKKLPCSIECEVFETREAFEHSSDGWEMTEDFSESLLKSGVLLKGPTKTQQGGGARSLNVFLRTSMGLYANIRPVKSAFTENPHTSLPVNLTIVRENSEDLYTGSEYWQCPGQAVALKLCTTAASERICRYAFEYARINAAPRVTCMTKDNIMKITDGIFHDCFRRVATEYPDIKADHQIIDIGSAMLATRPDEYGVVVTTNLYGDIISDIAAQVTGSVGLCGSANIGESGAMFEAIHGTAPDIAGKGIANPSGIISAATMMLAHMGEGLSASLLENAWGKVLSSGLLTADLSGSGRLFKNPQILSTKEFASAIEDHLETGLSRTSTIVLPMPSPDVRVNLENAEVGKLVGVDVTIAATETVPAAAMADRASSLRSKNLRKSRVMCGGTPLEKLPAKSRESRTLTVRYESDSLSEVSGMEVCELVSEIVRSGVVVTSTQNLYGTPYRRSYFE